MRSPSEPPEAQTAPKRTKVSCANVGWAIEGAGLLLLAAGWLAEQAGWMRFEWEWIIPIALLVQVGVVFLGLIDHATPKRKAEPGTAPNGGPAKPSGNSGVTEGPPSVS